MNETFCYEIYLKFEYNGKSGRIGLPVELKPRFKTLDPNAPSSEFISSLINDSIIRAAIDSIVESGSVFPGDPRAEQLKKTIREVLEGDHYTIEVEPINCEFDNIFGDPTNEDKPYPSVDDTAPPPTNEPNADNTNPEGKCYVATFTITTVSGLDNAEINVSLQSSANPLPDPISTDNPTINSIKTYVGAIDQKVADSIALPPGHSIWGVSWNGEFWKLCIEEKKENTDDTEDDTEDDLVESPRYKISIASELYLHNNEPVNEETVEYHVRYDQSAHHIEHLMNDIILEKILTQKGFNKNTFLYPRATDDLLVNLNIKGFTLIPGQTAITVAGWENAVAPKIAIYSTNPNNLPDSITIEMNIDVILKFNVPYGIYVDWEDFTAYLTSDIVDMDLDLQLFYSEETGKDGKGRDFSILHPIIIQSSEYIDVGGIISNPTWPNPSYTLLHKKDIDFHLEGDSFEITLNKDRPRRNQSGKYLADYVAENFAQIGKDQYKLAVEKNKNKILNSILEACDTQDAVNYAKKAVDIGRDILLDRGKLSVPSSQHECTKITYYRADFTFGPEYDISMKILKP